jgi:glycosyltransferase involved in cell wall biosynthesis
MNKQPTLVTITTVSESLTLFTGHARYLTRKGMTVHAIAAPGRLLDEYLQSEQVPFYPVQMHRRISPLSDLPALYKLYTYLRDRRPDIVQAQTPKAALLGMLAAWLARTPVRIYNVVGLRMMTAGPREKAILRLAEAITCTLATQVWCVSDSVRNVMIDEKLCPPSRITVLGHGSVNGIDSLVTFNPANVSIEVAEEFRNRYAIPRDAIVIGFLGRIVRDKGIIELAEAWKQVRLVSDQVRLIIVGVRESGDPVPNEVWNALASDPRVHITGFVPGTDLPAFFAAIDMLVLPTYREGFPVVTLEAASMERPVIATRVPGCVDAVINGVTGTLVNPKDADDLARAIKCYIFDANLRRTHGANARARVLKDFAQEPLWERMYQEYCHLVNVARRSSHR